MDAPQVDSGATGGPAKSARGGCLTALLVLMIMANLGTALLYLLNPSEIEHRFARLSHGLVVTLGMGALANVVLAILVWNWRRVGFWGLVATALMAFSINLYVGVGGFVSVVGLLGPLILGLLIRPKWALFR